MDLYELKISKPAVCTKYSNYIPTRKEVQMNQHSHKKSYQHAVIADIKNFVKDCTTFLKVNFRLWKRRSAEEAKQKRAYMIYFDLFIGFVKTNA